ncbi:MAG: hypothetical protein FJ390_04715 [Verrucomicrobia bacterium]|nr:hypothetical protein [Verrucomicrobiota bacterium]
MSMKGRSIFLIFPVLFFLGSDIFLKKNYFLKQEKNQEFSLSLADKKDQKNCCDIKENHRSSLPAKTPAPLNIATKQELADFPEAHVIECLEVAGPEPGQKTRKRILETKFKYPYIRTEEIIDVASSNLLKRTEMVADHLLVRLSAEADPIDFLEQCGPEAVSLEPVMEHDLLYRLKLTNPSLPTLTRILKTVASLPHLAQFGEPDFICHARFQPNDRLYMREQWNLNSTSTVSGFSSGINMETAWNFQMTAPSTIIAIVDTGINWTHEDLAANIWNNPQPQYNDLHGWSSITNDGNAMDDNGHGTMCAGIIGAVGNNSTGIAGIVWKTQLMSCKFLSSTGTGTDSDSITCINYACDHHANIINCSWGHQGGYSESLKMALQKTHDKKIIVVVASGNDGWDADTYPDYPSYYHFDNMVTVAATTANNELASFSDYGANTVQLAAPGDHIFSTTIGSNTSYSYGSGTSFATPHVTGALALLMAHFPKLSYDELIAHLMQTADKIPVLEGKVMAGRINVGNALKTFPNYFYWLDPWYCLY